LSYRIQRSCHPLRPSIIQFLDSTLSLHSMYAAGVVVWAIFDCCLSADCTKPTACVADARHDSCVYAQCTVCHLGYGVHYAQPLSASSTSPSHLLASTLSPMSDAITDCTVSHHTHHHPHIVTLISFHSAHATPADPHAQPCVHNQPLDQSMPFGVHLTAMYPYHDHVTPHPPAIVS
jgi:hypothetical protein